MNFISFIIRSPFLYLLLLLSPFISLPTTLSSSISDCRTESLQSQLISRAQAVDLNQINILQKIQCINQQTNGTIPTEIALFTNLRQINLDENLLSGPFPVEVTTLPLLQDLTLRDNKFAGGLPTQIGDFLILTRLDVRDNLFEGTFPPEIGQVTSLNQLFVGGNKFTGTMPPHSADANTDFVSGSSFDGAVVGNNNDVGDDNNNNQTIVIASAVSASLVFVAFAAFTCNLQKVRERRRRILDESESPSKNNFFERFSPKNITNMFSRQSKFVKSERRDPFNDMNSFELGVKKNSFNGGYGANEKNKLYVDMGTFNTAIDNGTKYSPDQLHPPLNSFVSPPTFDETQENFKNGGLNRLVVNPYSKPNNPGWFSKIYGTGTNKKSGKDTPGWFSTNLGKKGITFDDHDELDDLREKKERQERDRKMLQQAKRGENSAQNLYQNTNSISADTSFKQPKPKRKKSNLNKKGSSANLSSFYDNVSEENLTGNLVMKESMRKRKRVKKRIKKAKKEDIF